MTTSRHPAGKSVIENHATDSIVRISNKIKVSTALKMLIILGLALLPLGLIAAFASREAAHVNQLRHEAETRAAAAAAAISFTEALNPPLLHLRQAMDDLAQSVTEYPIDRTQCALRLRAVMQKNPNVSGLAIFDINQRLVCATPGYSKLAGYYAAGEPGYEVHLAGRARLLRANIAAGSGSYFGIVEFSVNRLAMRLKSLEDDGAGISLRQGSQSVTLSAARTNTPLDRIIRVTAPVANDQLSLEVRMPASPITALELLLILLPILTWAAGAIIGWIVIDRLLLRPLGLMQRAVTQFTAGGGEFTLPRLATPAHEIRDLGESFVQATEMLTRHETELAASLANQKRLTREVHHRVKNNLQVVSSLINLHARGAESDAVADAYARIQRRVDALAVVHRNHFAEFEANPGVQLRALIGEIASNLRASAQGKRAPNITLQLAAAFASQDVAVPIAFLITEIIELAMTRATGGELAITLTVDTDTENRATLTVAASALATEAALQGPQAERFQRIAEGLARQLRASLEHDVVAGRYQIHLPILAPMAQ